MKAVLAIALAVACSEPAPRRIATHSSSIALSPAGDRLFVVNADADSVSILDPRTRTRLAEIALGTPVLDPSAFTPSVMPRALAVSPDGAIVYVTGQRAGALFAIEVATAKVRSLAVGSEPIGVVVDRNGSEVFVACSQDDTVVRVDAARFAVTGRTTVPSEPWALAWSSDGALLVSHLLTPQITVLDRRLAHRASWTVPELALRTNDPRLPHGTPRGFYDLAPRPGSTDVWIPHLLLGIDTPQPRLDFETTVFPAVSLVRQTGYRRTLSVDVEAIARTDGAFGDVVSGPHAIGWTSDGDYALVVDTNSEDLLAIDARTEVQAALLRPLPGHLPEGIAIAPDDELAYVDQRNTSDVAVVRLHRTAAGLALSVEGAIPRLAVDPMPRELRLGQHLFYSANSDEDPITRNHWVACASCHIEGRSDAVTWRFEQGLRDTPSNAGGTAGTGFLFRTADRTAVQDYWQTVNVEQGGRFDRTAQAPLLDALAAYVDRAIPAPIPPTTNPALVARGRAVFDDPAVGCATCHRGPRLTDSGGADGTLDLAGTPVLHDVGTCSHEDVDHVDRDGRPRAACLFDTPSLTGLASSPPYLHDGRAATLRDVLALTRGTMGHTEQLGPGDLTALVEYLRSL